VLVPLLCRGIGSTARLRRFRFALFLPWLALFLLWVGLFLLGVVDVSAPIGEKTLLFRECLQLAVGVLEAVRMALIVEGFPVGSAEPFLVVVRRPVLAPINVGAISGVEEPLLSLVVERDVVVELLLCLAAEPLSLRLVTNRLPKILDDALGRLLCS